MMAGPLAGITIVEVGGIGPGPFAAMMLADHGAEVIRIERPGASEVDVGAVLRSRTIVEHDLKNAAGQAAARALCANADALIEGYRPGTMEKLGLGPEILLADNPRLIYGRMTGWGQDGPYAFQAGHDINYIALSGALHAIGPANTKPTIPLNLIADYGGGAMMLAFGMLAALIHARATGEGQVIDCAMSEGAALLMAPIYSRYGLGRWTDARGSNLLDGAAPFYECYVTADDGYIALGAIESQFYAALRDTLGLADDPLFDSQRDARRWPAQKARLTAIFATRTREEWCTILEPANLCFAPVLSLADAPGHPHNRARGAFIELDGIVQPAPAPRYSVTKLDPPRVSRRP